MKRQPTKSEKILGNHISISDERLISMYHELVKQNNKNTKQPD